MEYTDGFGDGNEIHRGGRQALPSATVTKALPLTMGPNGPKKPGHPNTNLPGKVDRWLLRLRECEAHQVLEGPALWFLCFQLRDLTGAVGRAKGGWKP